MSERSERAGADADARTDGETTDGEVTNSEVASDETAADGGTVADAGAGTTTETEAVADAGTETGTGTEAESRETAVEDGAETLAERSGPKPVETGAEAIARALEGAGAMGVAAGQLDEGGRLAQAAGDVAVGHAGVHEEQR